MRHVANERGRQSRPVAWLGFNPLVRSRIALQSPAFLASAPTLSCIVQLSLAVISTLFRHAVWTAFKPASSVWPLRCLG